MALRIMPQQLPHKALVIEVIPTSAEEAIYIPQIKSKPSPIRSAQLSTPQHTRLPERPVLSTAIQASSAMSELPTKIEPKPTLPPPLQAETAVLTTEAPIVRTMNDVSKSVQPLAHQQLEPPVATPQTPAVNPVETIEPIFDADYLHNPPPIYPTLSKRAHEVGKVVLKVYVEPSGIAGSVEIHEGSGFERLDKSALLAVRRWKFVPAKQGANAVGTWVLVPIVFNMKG
ncbi:MAG: energy transducer TonB [Methylophilaceae bacterium]|nr:energy transducer TonB [Methylophilaceae bacterium]